LPPRGYRQRLVLDASVTDQLSCCPVDDTGVDSTR
jgi:hypothetical protein